MTAPSSGSPGTRGSRWIVFTPLLVFAALAAVFLAMLLSGRDASTIPSALIGKPVPPTSLPPLHASASIGLETAEFSGQVTLVNVWASWCGPCRQEHPVLMALSQDGRFVIAGLNYKDKPENARSFLAELGDPYDAIGVDGSGRTAIHWGVYGVPETFLVGRDGTIRYKHVGPLTPAAVDRALMPEIEKALAEAPPGS